MVTVRTAVGSDAAAIARVHVDTWRDAYAGMLPDRVLLGLTTRRQRHLWDDAVARDTVLVAETDGVVGFGSCGRSRAAALPYDGEVFTLYVHPNHQGRGVGRRLLAGLFARLVTRGIASGLVWVIAENPARYFYQAMGAAPVAVRDERLWGTRVREMAYGWPDLERAREALAVDRSAS